MPLERRDPIPPGRYWMDVFTPNTSAFNDWLDANSGSVRVVTSERHEAIGGYPAFDWVLYTVSTPTARWKTPALGYPTIAPPSVKSYADVVQAPTVSPPSTIWLYVAGAVVALIAGLYLGRKSAPRAIQVLHDR